MSKDALTTQDQSWPCKVGASFFFCPMSVEVHRRLVEPFLAFLDPRGSTELYAP